jgi:DNA-binding NarL/FixJ family response regulator
VNTTKTNGTPETGGTNGQHKARIFILEGQTLFRFGLASLLNQQPNMTVVGEAATVAEALPAIHATRPTLLTLELALKAGNGLEFIKELREQDEELGILVLSTQDEMLNAELALHAGASGYLMKDASI